ncbi:NADH-quinone oxidoreductase subunit NuoN [Bacillus taeanensis]|uniref:NADH-quinone oxidoreductase subunit N n=1 Tax=Bacillus taeanensis TaxID=273032 RepID=A0A366XQV5_9BACI|nr:NADH-quinone oxidoreductase subunit NuoN [Bacillus taeanensis]RBW68740.1 NADH-quinone oxidoreductase subunit NuoN [Bacillus taeanensis]
MDLETLLSYEWSSMAPEFTILITATLLSLLDLFIGKDKDRKGFVFLGLLGIVVSLVFLVGQFNEEVTTILNNTYRLDSFAKAFKLLMLIGTGLVFLMALDRSGIEKEYRGEFYYLMLTALLGGMMMASSADLITLFVGLELLSLSSYILVGMRKNNLQSNEAAFKYVVNGSIATAFTLFGMSYLYGFTGTTNLYEIAGAIANPLVQDNAFLMIFAFFLLFGGLSFKIAAAPFHMWAPDVYQGAATPVTAFLSVVSKTAGFALLIRMMVLSFAQAPGLQVLTGVKPLLLSVQPYIAFLAGITMIVGNTAALRQRNVKRLFAYSSIAHAGYLLVPFISLSGFLFNMTAFYLGAYLLMNLGAFAILHYVTTRADSEDLNVFSGLYKKNPLLALGMTIFLLSLAGIPLTAGFIGKYGIFMTALSTVPKHYFLVGVMLATTIVSYIYYFNIMVQMYFRKHEGEEREEASLPIGIRTVIIVCLAGTLLFGIFPGIGLEFMNQHFNFSDVFLVK